MNDLYIHQLETENKQLRIALQECRKAWEEEITTKKKAIEHIKENQYWNGDNYNCLHCEKLLKILGDKE